MSVYFDEKTLELMRRLRVYRCKKRNGTILVPILW